MKLLIIILVTGLAGSFAVTRFDLSTLALIFITLGYAVFAGLLGVLLNLEKVGTLKLKASYFFMSALVGGLLFFVGMRLFEWRMFTDFRW